jgi:hypothetical protein
MKEGEKHMSKKYEIADWLTLENAKTLYQEHEIALIVTDGKFVEITKDDEK